MKCYLSVFQNITCIILFGVFSSVYSMENSLLENNKHDSKIESVRVYLKDKNKFNDKNSEKIISTVSRGNNAKILSKRPTSNYKSFQKILVYGTAWLTITLLCFSTFCSVAEADPNKNSSDIRNQNYSFCLQKCMTRSSESKYLLIAEPKYLLIDCITNCIERSLSL